MNILNTIIGIFLFRKESYLRLKETDTKLKIAAIISVILASLGMAYGDYLSQMATVLAFPVYPLLFLFFAYLVAEIIHWVGRKIQDRPHVWTLFCMLAFISLPEIFSFISPVLQIAFVVIGLMWSLYGIRVLFNISWGRSIGINVLAILISIPVMILIIFLIGILSAFIGTPLYHDMFLL